MCPPAGEYVMYGKDNGDIGVLTKYEQKKQILKKFDSGNFNSLRMIFYLSVFALFTLFSPPSPKKKEISVRKYRNMIIHKTMGAYHHITVKPDSMCTICYEYK